MTKRRMVLIFCLFVFLLMVDLAAVMLVANNSHYALSAGEQVTTTLSVPQNRGGIFDRNGIRLTDTQTIWYALCMPGESSYATLYSKVGYEQQNTLYAKRNSVAPFFLKTERDLSETGIFCIATSARYDALPVAEHLIGYLDGEGNGVCGIERAYNELLADSADKAVIACTTTARGELAEGTAPEKIVQSGSGQGVMLTIDAGIQRICEGIAQQVMRRGSILVLESNTAEVLADVSVPYFDPQNIGQSIRANDTSLIHRALAGYNIGSVFKPVLAAAALENGYDWFYTNCEGSVEVDGQIYRCAKGIPHGKTNLLRGLAQSCNCYFIELGQALGGNKILEMSKSLGFGSATAVADGLSAEEGNLPDEKDLHNTGQLSVFSFGQGKLVGTPLQVAGMMNTIAAEGQYRAPSFVVGIADSQGRLVQKQNVGQSTRAMQKSTAKKLQSMLRDVVTEGIGKEAETNDKQGAGKTGTAQTGRYDAAGEELMDYWFAGFYPAEDPKVTIVVLQDEITAPEVSCAAIYSQICNTLKLLENS